MVWLIGDRHGQRRQQLQNAGWSIGFTIMAVLLMMHVAFGDLVYPKKDLVYYIVEFGGMGDNDDVSIFIGSMTTDQLHLCGLILLEAPENSRTWTSPHGKRSEMQGWSKQVTRWCGLVEAKPQTTKGEIE